MILQPNGRQEWVGYRQKFLTQDEALNKHNGVVARAFKRRGMQYKGAFEEESRELGTDHTISTSDTASRTHCGGARLSERNGASSQCQLWDGLTTAYPKRRVSGRAQSPDTRLSE
ncbi:hypothetical protein R1sor_017453 [Riccia sorocarpa]|uniref:Uncharacterized protein n=1 Tax=Riccia sorocarpa TaxID=122646 RepID=A0ABD3IAW2_9MARC